MSGLRRLRIDSLVVTCEHGGRDIPRRYAPLFARADRALASHRGWDRGALRAARRLARALEAPLHASTVSRLLVELNRSPRHPRLFSEFTRDLDVAERERLLAHHWHPYRAAVERDLAARVEAGRRVLHLSIHSFAPVLKGVRRHADLGLLYDPRRPFERSAARALRAAIESAAPGLRVRLNYPYRGTDDGFTTWLRRRLPARCYAGIEIEFNRARLDERGPAIPAVVTAVELALRRLLGRPPV